MRAAFDRHYADTQFYAEIDIERLDNCLEVKESIVLEQKPGSRRN